MVDENGLPEALHLDAAGRNDRYAFGNSVDQIPKDAYLAADKGYDCKKLRRRLRHKGLRPLVPRRQFENKTTRRTPKPHLYKTRWTIERYFAWLVQSRSTKVRTDMDALGVANLESLKSAMNITGKTGKPSGNWVAPCSVFKRLPYEF